MINRELSEK